MQSAYFRLLEIYHQDQIQWLQSIRRFAVELRHYSSEFADCLISSCQSNAEALRETPDWLPVRGNGPTRRSASNCERRHPERRSVQPSRRHRELSSRWMSTACHSIPVNKMLMKFESEHFLLVVINHPSIERRSIRCEKRHIKPNNSPKGSVRLVRVFWNHTLLRIKDCSLHFRGKSTRCCSVDQNESIRR